MPAQAACSSWQSIKAPLSKVGKALYAHGAGWGLKCYRPLLLEKQWGSRQLRLSNTLLLSIGKEGFVLWRHKQSCSQLSLMQPLLNPYPWGPGGV